MKRAITQFTVKKPPIPARAPGPAAKIANAELLKLNLELRALGLHVQWDAVNNVNYVMLPAGGIRVISTLEEGIRFKGLWDEEFADVGEDK